MRDRNQLNDVVDRNTTSFTYSEFRTMRILQGIVLYLMVSPLLGFQAQSCVWKITLSKSLNDTDSSSHLNSMESIDITSTINEMDFVCLKQSDQKRFYAFEYNLIMEVDCAGNDQPGRKSRGIILQGSPPQIKICSYPVQEANRAAVCRLAGAVLVDLADYTGQTCSEAMCRPAWVLPIQWDPDSVCLIVEVDGGAWDVQSTRITLHLHGYDRFGTSETVLTVPQTLTGPVDINYIPGKFNVMIWGPLLPMQSLYLSFNDFETSGSLQYAGIGSRPSICPCMGTEPHILKSAALIDRLLILTQAGLHEVHEIIPSDEEAVDPEESTYLFSLCAQDLIIPSHSKASKQLVLLIGGCSDERSVYAAEFIPRTGPLVFNNLTTPSDEGPCDITPATGCHVVTCASSALNKHTVFCLLYADSHYSFVRYTDSTWQLLNDLQLTMPVPSYTVAGGLRPLTWYTDVNGTSSDIVLSRITLSLQVTRHIYLTGSHVLHSPDAGRNFYMMPWNISGSVTLTCTSSSGYVVFVTEQNEIWVSQIGHSKAEQVFPSMAWIVAHRLHGLPLPSNQMHIASAFFDTHDDFQLLLLEDGTIRKHAVPLTEIHQLLATSQHWLDTVAGGTVMEVSSPCVFSRIYFYTPHHILYTRAKLYSYGPPLRNPHQQFHSYESLLMYHALIDNLESYEALLYTKSESQEGNYGHNYVSYVQQWKSILNASQPYHGYLYSNDMLGDGIHVDLSSYIRVFNDSNETNDQLPEVICLDYKQSYNFSIFLTLEDKPPAHDPLQNLNQLVVSFESANNDILLITTERIEFGYNNTVKYQVTISDNGLYTGQSVPGVDLFPSSVIFTVSQAPLKCMEIVEDKLAPQGQYILDVQIGCAPGQYVMFDWQAAWSKVNESYIQKEPYDCLDPDPALPCFYFKQTFYPYFTIYDDTTGSLSRFEGNYTLKVIGGKQKANDEIQMFTEEEISLYNQMIPFPHRVWIPVNTEPPVYDDWPVYNHTNNGIFWLCNLNTRCSGLLPVVPNTPDYYFLIEFSNRDVDDRSYCNYTQTFLVHVHGLPLDRTYFASLLLGVTVLIMLNHLVIYYLCHRENSKVWNQFSATFHDKMKQFKEGRQKKNTIVPKDLEHRWATGQIHSMREDASNILD